jgi:HEAT repeat protein
LSHPNPVVRHWCCRYLDHRDVDSKTQHRLIAALRDDNRKVRHQALHALTCGGCKPAGECEVGEVDVTRYVIERLRTDPSLRVRRLAALTLSSGPFEPRVKRALKGSWETESDAKLRRFIESGLSRHQG